MNGYRCDLNSDQVQVHRLTIPRDSADIGLVDVRSIDPLQKIDRDERTVCTGVNNGYNDAEKVWVPGLLRPMSSTGMGDQMTEN